MRTCSLEYKIGVFYTHIAQPSTHQQYSTCAVLRQQPDMSCISSYCTVSFVSLALSTAGQDKRRMLAVVVDSAVVTGPTLHAMYGALEALIPTTGGGWLPASLHLIIDIVLFDPIFVASFFCVTGVLENRPLLTDVLPGLRR